jgi:SAM-dependent methyltransferase
MGADDRRSTLRGKIYYGEKESAIYDLENAWKTDDIEFWKNLAHEFTAPDKRALELACGTLRVLLPVAESGIAVTGVDLSLHMLAIARKKLARALPETQARVTLIEGDMRALRLDQKFKLIYLPFNTFLVLITAADQLALFDTVRAHLAPGGVFAFDIFFPDINRLRVEGTPTWALEIDQASPELGFRFQRDMARELDPIHQRLTVHFRMREYKDDVLVREWLSDLEMTYIFPRELEHLIARAGFDVVHYWGDYARRDFYATCDPQKQLLVVRPR